MLQPHRSRYWENPNITDWEAFSTAVFQICLLRREAQRLYAQGVHVISCDEKPGIQAIERAGKTLPMKPGHCARIEFNYIRHGTQVVTANLHLATGQQLTPTVADTRTEPEFVAHVATLNSTDPQASWIILCDNLNTHMSESLVKYVAAATGDTQDIGVKGKTGILKSMKTRAAYLADESHRIRFVYTPKHCSWLNPIEVWFSVLDKHVIRRGTFTSTAELKRRLLEYIAYYNHYWAKAYDWSVTKTKDIQQMIDKVRALALLPDETDAISGVAGGNG